MLTEPDTYQMRVKGHLELEWSEWFEGLTLSWEQPDKTVLSGQIADQAALHGILNKIRDLGVPLLSVKSTRR